MARRKNHHPKSNECASSTRSAPSANSKVSSNNSHSNNNRTCQVANESKTSIKRNGIRVHSEEEEEEDESEGLDEEDEVAGDGDGEGEDELVDEKDNSRPEEFVRSNNNSSNNNKKRKLKRKRRKRLGRPVQISSMDDYSSAQVSNGSGGQNSRDLANGHNQSFQCPSCKLVVDSASEFTKHIRQHNNVESALSTTHSCSLCGKVLSSASSLDRHMLVHSGERPFKCSRCEMAFTTNGNMHRHMRTHHDAGHKSSSPSMNNSVNNNSNISDDEYNNNSNNNNNRKSRGAPVKRKLHLTTDGSLKKPVSGAAAAVAAGGGRNLWSKRSRVSVSENDVDENIDEKEEEEAENINDDDDDEEEMSVDSLPDGTTLQCPLCSKGFLCKSGLRRHLEGHPASDLKCKDCSETFSNWQTLLKHLHVVHFKGVEASTVFFGNEGATSILLNNNKAVDVGFHDLTYVDFSTAKFALIAKSACEKHVRRPSSVYHVFQCHHCHKAFPCSSSLKMHLKTTHVLINAKRNSLPTSTTNTAQQLLNSTATCVKCQAAFATRRQLECHSLRHQATEQCATPYSKDTFRETQQLPKMQLQQQIVDPAAADLAPEIDVNLDKKSFLALLELQSKNCAEENEQEEEDDLVVKGQVKNVNGVCNGNVINKIQRVSDIQSNDFADIQSIIAVTSSTTMNIIPSILKMASSPAATRPSSTLSSDLPASPRLADSVTASPELPSPIQNQLTTESNSDSNKDKDDSEDKTSIEEEDDKSTKETPLVIDDCSEMTPLVLVNKNVVTSNSPTPAVDLSSPSVRTPAAAPVEILAPTATPSLISSPSLAKPGKCSVDFEAHLKQFPQNESNSLKSLIDLTNNAAFDPPQEQPLDLAIQPIDLTISNAKKFSSPSSSSSSSSSASTLPIDLSASSRQRSSIINHPLSPLLTSTPATGYRRISPLISPLPSQVLVTQQQAQQPQQQTLFEASPLAFSNRFSTTVTAENYSSSILNANPTVQRFHPDNLRRSVAVQPSSSPISVIQKVAENGVPLTLVQHTSSHNVGQIDNPIKNTSLRNLHSSSTSANSSASSAFLLKKQKQRRYRTERPFKCNHCAAGFTLRSNMERHIKQQHPEFWASKSRGRKDRALTTQQLPSRTASLSPSLPLVQSQSRLVHSVTVPNVAFPSIPPPQNVTEYNPVLAAAAALTHSRPAVILDRSSSPSSLISRLSSTVTNSTVSKVVGTISDEVKQAISNQIKQRQNIDVGIAANNPMATLAAAAASLASFAGLKSPTLSENGSTESGSTSNTESNGGGGKLINGGSVRQIWRPAPQMEPNVKALVEDADEAGADLASVSTLLSTAKQQNIQELFRTGRNCDDDDDDEDMEGDNNRSGSRGSGGRRTEESEEDQPLAALKGKDAGGDLHSKSSKDGRKSAYVNAPNRVACPYCNRQFPWTSSLRRHVLTHTGQKPYKCPKCPLWFTTKSNCDRHLSRKHGGGSGSVSASINFDSMENGDGQLTTNPNVNASLATSLASQNADCTARNAPDRPHRCHLCLSSTFSTPGNLQKHMMSKHPNQVFGNPSTSPGSISKGNQLRETLSSSGSQQEKESGECSSSTTSPTYSERNGGGESSSGSEGCWGVESEESGEDLTINESGLTEEPMFVCFICLKSFADRGHCLEHLKAKHPDEHAFLKKGELSATNISQDDNKSVTTSSKFPERANSPDEEES